MELIKYRIKKPIDELEDDFINRITDNVHYFVHDINSKDLSIVCTYNDLEEELTVKTLKLLEHAN